MARKKGRGTGSSKLDLKPIVLRSFGGQRKCYGHCDQPATLRVIAENRVLVTATVCHRGYVSRLVAYGLSDNRRVVSSLVKSALGPKGDFNYEDVRTATRYTWDMGIENRAREIVFRVAYWTQNYRRTKSGAADRNALFTCARCNALFLQPVASLEAVCSACLR